MDQEGAVRASKSWRWMGQPIRSTTQIETRACIRIN